MNDFSRKNLPFVYKSPDRKIGVNEKGEIIIHNCHFLPICLQNPTFGTLPAPPPRRHYRYTPPDARDQLSSPNRGQAPVRACPPPPEHFARSAKTVAPVGAVSQREALSCRRLPRRAAERTLVREGKRTRGKIRCESASQRRVVPAAVKPPELESRRNQILSNPCCGTLSSTHGEDYGCCTNNGISTSKNAWLRGGTCFFISHNEVT